MVDIWSMSEAVDVIEVDGFLAFTMFFLAGVTEKSLESGGIILMDLATLSLFLMKERRVNKKINH